MQLGLSQYSAEPGRLWGGSVAIADWVKTVDTHITGRLFYLYAPSRPFQRLGCYPSTKVKHDSHWTTTNSITAEVGCTPEALRMWVRQTERDRGLCEELSGVGCELLNAPALDTTAHNFGLAL